MSFKGTVFLSAFVLTITYIGFCFSPLNYEENVLSERILKNEYKSSELSFTKNWKEQLSHYHRQFNQTIHWSFDQIIIDVFHRNIMEMENKDVIKGLEPNEDDALSDVLEKKKEKIDGLIDILEKYKNEIKRIENDNKQKQPLNDNKIEI